MSTTLRQVGSPTVTATASSTVTSNQVVVFQNFLAIAESDYTSGEKAVFHTSGVHSLAKVTGTAVAQGDTLYWDIANSRLTPTYADGLIYAGTANEAAASGAATCEVMLNAGGFAPVLVADVTVASGATTGTATVGTSYNGATCILSHPAAAVTNAVAPVSAVIAAGTLTVTVTGDPGASGASYRVFVMP